MSNLGISRESSIYQESRRYLLYCLLYLSFIHLCIRYLLPIAVFANTDQILSFWFLFYVIPGTTIIKKSKHFKKLVLSPYCVLI
jgi:hypothetical protein